MARLTSRVECVCVCVCVCVGVCVCVCDGTCVLQRGAAEDLSLWIDSMKDD